MKSYFFKRCLALSLLVAQGAYAVSDKLKTSDVKGMFEEMLNLHVEYKEFTPALARRSIRIFVEQFDPNRIYLLASEVQPYLDMNDDQLMHVVHGFYSNNFTVFTNLNSLIQKSILRARELRSQIVKDLLLTREEISSPQGEIYSSYANSVQELKLRFKKQMLNILAAEKKHTIASDWNAARKQKVFQLWEKRFVRSESTYLSSNTKSNNADHYLALHLMKSQSKSLDAHTSFFSPEEAIEMRASLEKQFEGVGIVLREGIDGILITNVVKGGPAEKSGKISAGDLLVEIDGKAIDSAGYDEVLKRLKGERGSRVVLGVRHKSKVAKSGIDRVELVRERIVMQDDRVKYTSEKCQDGIIGKIVLPSFYESGGSSSCERDMREAIRNLKKEGNLVGVVIDMRDNSGGFLSQAVKMAGLFISSGVVVISKYSKGEMQYLRDVDGRIFYDGPLVVLTSKASASAAEIVAQALQDYGVAVVVGDERTYGKGTIQYQTVTDDNAQNFFKVTVGRYYTVSGRSTQIEGVKADVVVPTSYAPYNIGERYLAYPLKNDQVPSAYNDSLADIDPKNRMWFQKNYIPNVQKKLSIWTQAMSELKKKSSERIAANKSFSEYLHKISSGNDQGYMFGDNADPKVDFQLQEAVNILKDMIDLKNQQ